VPAGADLQAAIDAAPVAATLCLKAGTYRIGSPLRPKRGQRLYGRRGTILSGARPLRGWTRDQGTGFWWHHGDTAAVAPATGRCAGATVACRDPDDVWRDDVRLTRVGSLAALGPGRVLVDRATDRITVADDPTGSVLERSVTPWAVVAGGVNQGRSRVVLAGVVVQRFASPAQTAAIQMGPDWTVEGVEVRENHGLGVAVGSRSVLRGSHVHHQGQLGVGGSGAIGALVEGNEIDHNNTAGYDGQWEAGGGKWVGANRDLTVRGNYVHNNVGPGLWTDSDNVDTTYEHNLVRDNTGVGILHETSYAAVIRGNDVRHNAEAAAGQSIWHGADILLNCAQHVQVQGNLVASSSNGIGLVAAEDRGRGRFGTYRLGDVEVRDNLVVLANGARTGLVGQAATAGDADVRFDSNTYYIPDPAGRFWQWGDQSLTADQWRRDGHDTTGVVRVP
jgi:Right handed beta helix region